jgi:hypothetical protein
VERELIVVELGFCKKCMNRGLVVIKLPEMWLDREGYRKIAGEVA